MVEWVADAVAQFGQNPVRDLLVVRGYFIGVAILASMVFLRFRTRQRFKRWVYWGFGVLAIVFFTFATGTVSFYWPFPGAIWSIGLSMVVFVVGLTTGWVLWGPEAALVTHDRRQYPSELDEKLTDEPSNDHRRKRT